MKTVLAIFGVTLISLFGAGSALECYQCMEGIDPTLVALLPEPLKSLLSGISSTKCFDSYDTGANNTCNSGTKYCAQLTAKIDGDKAVVRGCADPTLLNYEDKVQCSGTDLDLEALKITDFKACFCDEELCNASVAVKSTVGLLLLGQFLYFFL